MRRPILVGIGEILWDMLPGGKQLGGAPANFAYQAKARGGIGAAVSQVGDDALGREMIESLDRLGVDRTYVTVDRSHPTGAVEVRLDRDGVPDYVIHENVAWDYLPSHKSIWDFAARVDCVCFGSLAQRSATSRKAIQTFLRTTRSDCLRIFDINLRQHYYTTEIIEESLKLSSVLKLNDQELPIVSRLLGLENDEDVAIRTLIKRFGLKGVVLTRGAVGSSLFWEDNEAVHQPAIAVEVKDTVGAGDAFTAAVAHGILGEMAMDETGRRAAEVAAYVCSQAGATPAMPERLRILPTGD